MKVDADGKRCEGMVEIPITCRVSRKMIAEIAERYGHGVTADEVRDLLKKSMEKGMSDALVAVLKKLWNDAGDVGKQMGERMERELKDKNAMKCLQMVAELQEREVTQDGGK